MTKFLKWKELIVQIYLKWLKSYKPEELFNENGSIKTEILRAKQNRPLYIIHNLITYTTIEHNTTHYTQSTNLTSPNTTKYNTKKQQKKW